MATIERTFDVRLPRAEVIAYLRDFGNAEEWDPGTESCRRLDDGPIGVGSRWHNASTIAGVSTELVYELTELTDERVVVVGRNDTATSTDTITVVDGERGGSRLTYHAEIEMSGVAKLADPAMKVVFEKVGSDVERDLTAALDRRLG